MIQLLLLANSTKYGGRCLAGINCETGLWERPISTRENGEWPIDQVKELQVFDLIEYSTGSPCPRPHHPEDICLEYPPRKVRHLSAQEISTWCLGLSNPTTLMLWGMGGSVPAEDVDAWPLKHSLCAFRIREINVIRDKENKKWRCLFNVNRNHYNLPFTDCHVIEKLKQNNTEWRVPETPVMVCVSVGELFQDNAHYKIVATIRTIPSGD